MAFRRVLGQVSRDRDCGKGQSQDPAPEGDRRRAVVAGVSGAAGLDEAKCAEGCMILRQFHPGLQFQPRQIKRTRACYGLIDQSSGKTPTPLALRHRKFAQVQRPGFRGQKQAGDRVADDPDFALPHLLAQGFGCACSKRGRWIDPAVHVGELCLQQGKDRGQKGWVGGWARRHVATMTPWGVTGKGSLQTTHRAVKGPTKGHRALRPVAAEVGGTPPGRIW